MTHQEKWTVGDDGGKRLDMWLASQPSVGSRRRAREAIATGKVDVDGQVVGEKDAGQSLSPGASVALTWNRLGTSNVSYKAKKSLSTYGMRVLHDGDALIAVFKPAGLLTDAATFKQKREQDTARGHLNVWLASRRQQAWCCHRIDRDTSGVVLFATNEDLALRVREQFAAHAPRRVYHAVVHGVVDDEMGVWTDTMAWESTTHRQCLVDSKHPKAAEASAAWRVLRRLPSATVIEVCLTTGRRNQIRVHLMRRGLHLYGERQYLPDGVAYRHDFSRQALHASSLTVRHPDTGQDLVFEAAWPRDLATLVKKLDRSAP